MEESGPLTAWLIKWEWEGEHAKVDQPYVDIVSERISESYISDYIQRLHDLKCRTLIERADYSRDRNPPEKPYKVTRKPTTYSGVVFAVGHNPILTAEKVRNLVVKIDTETELEILTWDRYHS